MKCPNLKCNADNPNDAYYCHSCRHQFKKKINGWAIFFAILFLVATYFAIPSTELEQKAQSLEMENNRLKSDNTNLQNELNGRLREIEILKNQPPKTVTKEKEIIIYKDNPEQAKTIEKLKKENEALKKELDIIKEIL